MKRYRNATVRGAACLGLLVFLSAGLVRPGAVFGGHKLQGSQCYDCHAVGASLSDVVTDSRLIRVDQAKMTNFTGAGWSTGTNFPCVYCHDDVSRAVRGNMIGVEKDFTTGLSRHPVAPYLSSSASAIGGATLDCVDCHALSAISYVKGGSSPGTTLSPNIHNQNVAGVAWSPASSGLVSPSDSSHFYTHVATATDPSNAGNNSFCTDQCHDNSTGTGVQAGQAAHAYRTPIVSLETNGTLYTASQIGGCLDETASTGCHSPHFSLFATDLITVGYYDTNYPVQRDDCGACHVFDDPPNNPAFSVFNTDGHGRIGINLTCVNCHDPAIPHFQASGLPSVGSSEGRLNFVLDSTPSGFSTPAKSRLSICVSSSCHSGYLEHAPSTSGSYPVGCLDCHDPHGYGVGSNIMMMRQSAPIASTTVTLSYINSGDWYDSAQPTGFTNFACDSADCHPLSINAIMDTTTGTHGGGTGLKTGCENCHKHQGGEYSWAATGCDQCHGAAGSYWPSDTSSPDDGGALPNNAGRHPAHRQEIAAALGYNPATTNDGLQKTMCRYCHKVGDSDHTSSTRAEVFTVGYAKAIWDTATEAPSETNASFVAGTNLGTCNDVDCHNNKQTAAGYRWYESTAAACTMCHTVGTGNASAFVDPESGLHDESPRVSGVTHDDSFSYSGSTGGCVTCHTATPSSAHYDGNDDSTIGTTGNTAIAFTAGVGFADSTVPPTCAVSIAGCHLEADVGETWKRLWTENADQTDGTECAGCHGDFTAGWTGGVMHAAAPSTKGNGTHANTGLLTYECTDCHAIGDATPNYAFTSSSNDWNQNAGEISNHGNALISMNVNGTAWTRAAGRSGCPRCHGGPGTAYDFGQTSWTADTVSGDVPPVGCDGCHGVSGLYWPEIASVQTTDYPDRRGSHAAHIDALEAKIGYDNTPGVYTTNDAEQRHLCEYCHNDINGVGGSDHWDYVIPADVGSFNAIWSTATPAPGATDADGAITGAKSCQNVDCHYDKPVSTETTPGTWYVLGTAGCDYCHAYQTTYTAGSLPGSHDVHVDEAASSGYDYPCSTCHPTPANNWHADGSAKSDVSFSGIAVTAGFGSPVYGTTAETCDNVYCHGLSGLPDWDAGTGAACGTCHGDSSGKPDHVQSGASHATGAHSVAAAADCTKCHENTVADTSKHAQGPATTEGAALVSSVASSITAYSYGAHLGTDTDGYRYSAGTCQTSGCHDTSAGVWGGSGGCTFCHGYPPTTASGHASGVASVNHTSAAITPNHDECSFCHGVKNNGSNQPSVMGTDVLKGSYLYSWSGDHNDGKTTMNGDGAINGSADDAGYNSSNGGCDTAKCHVNAGHQVGTGGPVQLRDFGPGLCTSCHGAVSPDAGVGTNSSHLATVTGGSNAPCEACHPGGTKGATHSKNSDAGVVAISNYSAVGITYGHLVDTGIYGFVLGGDATVGAQTEAEICWGCHDQNGDGDLNDANDISEWGINQNISTGNLSYNYGTLNQANWVGATWRSGTSAFSFKQGSVQSTHTANTSGSSTLGGSDYNRTESADAVNLIRCSYCHDVHNTAGLHGVSNDPSGEPFIRGTWKGNPYKEDGPPLNGMGPWTSAGEYGAEVPRGSASSTNAMGGFWIDQNSGNPNSGATAASTAGLCDLCHNAASPGTAANWVSGYDGHANAIVGGAGRGTNLSTESKQRNIFNRTWRGSGDAYNNQRLGWNPYVDMAVNTASGTADYGYSYRGNNPTALELTPYVNAGNTRPRSFAFFQWNSDWVTAGIAAGTVELQVSDHAGNKGLDWNPDTEPYVGGYPDYDAQANYHTFNCGKCHNPHASRLPKLMITNCLDTSHNTWDENNTESSATGLGTNIGSSPWANTYASQWASAQNCHRLDERGSNATPDISVGRGWNKVTPW